MVVGVAFALALANMAGVRNLIWLTVGFGGIRMMGQGALSMVTMVSVSLWFEQRRGVAMGVLATIAGAGIVAVPFALNAVILATSWRTAWLVAAAVILLTVVPLGRFGLVDRPATVGQYPDGIEPRDTDPKDTRSSTSDLHATSSLSRKSLTRAQAARTRQFWILIAISSVSSMLITGLNFHQIDLLAEAGLSSAQAAAMFLPQIIGSSVFGIGVGYLIDRVGVRFVPAFAISLLIVVHLLGAAVEPGVIVFVYAIALGATGGAIRSALTTMVPGYFGIDHIGSIQGVMTVASVAGSAVGPVTLALVEGWLGSYRSANLVLIVLPAVALAFTLTNQRLQPSEFEVASHL